MAARETGFGMTAWTVAALILGTPVPSGATTLFSDSLQGTLSQWSNPVGAGQIVAAPGGGNALTFDQLQGGSNMLTTLSSFASTTGSFTITFDIYANCGHTSGCGTFLAATGSTPSSSSFTLSDTPFSSIPQFPDYPGWETVQYTFGGTSTQLAFEDWTGSPYAQAYPGQNAIYIRDLVLTDNPTNIPVATVSTSAVDAPEPMSALLFGTALISLAVQRSYSGRRRMVVRP